MNKLPSREQLMPALVEVMTKAAGEMKTAEIYDAVVELLGINDELLEIEDANCTGSEYSYRMRWARTALKNQNVIVNPKRGIWKINSAEK